MSSYERVSTTPDRLREAMTQAGKKQIDLVNDTGLNRGTISRYLSGEYEPKQTAIYKLAKALDVSEMWLWGFDCPKERPAEQKENDALADLVVRLQQDREFRQLIFQIGSLTPDQLQAVRNLLQVFQ